MKRFAVLLMAAALMGGVLSPVFVFAASEITVSSSSHWVRDTVPMYNASGFGQLEILDGNIVNPYYLVRPSWSYVPGHYNLSLDSNGYFSKDGYFSSGFHHCTFSQTLSKDVSDPYIRVIELDFTKSLNVDGKMEFYIDTGSSSIDFTVSNLPSSYAVQWIDAAYFYYDSNGDLHWEYVTGSSVTAPNGGGKGIYRFTFSDVHYRISSIMIKVMYGSNSLPSEMTSGTPPVVNGDFYFSDVVYETPEGTETSTPNPDTGSVDLKPIESQLDGIQSGIDGINDGIGDLNDYLQNVPDLSEWEASQMIGAAALDEFGKYKFNTFPPVPTTNPGDNYFTSQLWQVVDSIGNIGIPFSTPALEWLCFGDSERVFRIYHFIGWFTTIFATRAFIHAISGKVKEKNNPIHGDGDD